MPGKNAPLAMDAIPPTENHRQVQGTAAFSKFMAVLQMIADDPGELDIAKLTKTLPYPRGTLYRILAALEAEGMVVEEKSTGRLHLGQRLISLASKSWEKFDLRTVAHEHLAALRDKTGETVHLAIPSGQEMVYIDKIESPQSVRMISRIGTRVSLYSTSVGKAYLAALSAEDRATLLDGVELKPRTAYTITSIADLEAAIHVTEQTGFAVDGEENELEIRCFGAAILDREHAPIGCVSVSIPKYRFDERASQKYVKDLMTAVQNISKYV